jgi:hypothetical protein
MADHRWSMLTQFAAAEARVAAWHALVVGSAQHHPAQPRRGATSSPMRGSSAQSRPPPRGVVAGLPRWDGPVPASQPDLSPLRKTAKQCARVRWPVAVSNHGVLKTRRVSYRFTASQLCAPWRTGKHALLSRRTLEP